MAQIHNAGHIAKLSADNSKRSEIGIFNKHLRWSESRCQSRASNLESEPAVTSRRELASHLANPRVAVPIRRATLLSGMR